MPRQSTEIGTGQQLDVEAGTMTRAGVVDPIPRRGGGSPRFNIIVWIAMVVLIVSAPFLLYFSSSNGGFSEVKDLASIKCLGCLGLDPVVPGFKDFWTVYPEDHEKSGQEVQHPEFVRNALSMEGTDVLILFFWTQGCVPCAEQWEGMVEEGIASGPEDGGREGPKYDTLSLYSFDAAIDREVKVDLDGFEMKVVPNELYWTYHFNGRPNYNGVPCTVFIYERDGTVHWFMFYGQMGISRDSSLLLTVTLF
jgi:hypothetical protein